MHRLGHNVRVLLRAEKSEPEPRLLFTCTRCFVVKMRLHRLRRWTQRCTPDASLQARRQKQLKILGPRRAQLYTQFDQRNRRKLCDIWNMSADERKQLQARVQLLSKQGPANQWIRDVTADGDVEPNPGPSTSSSGDSRPGPDAFRLTYVNVGGVEHMFDVIDYLAAFRSSERPQVFCIAECRAGPSEQAAATSRLQRQGYNAYWVASSQEAQAGGRSYWKGGLCVAVARHVRCRQLHSWTGHADDIQVLDFEGFRVMTVWRRPCVERDEFDAEVTHLFGDAADCHLPCLAAGDWNDTPSESWLPDLGLQLAAPMEHGAFIPVVGAATVPWTMPRSMTTPGQCRQSLTLPSLATTRFCSFGGKCSSTDDPASNSDQRRRAVSPNRCLPMFGKSSYRVSSPMWRWSGTTMSMGNGSNLSNWWSRPRLRPLLFSQVPVGTPDSDTAAKARSPLSSRC